MMMMSVLYKRGAAGPLDARLGAAFGYESLVLAKEEPCRIESGKRFATSSPHPFAKHFVFVPSSQRDAQVTRREPEKAFRHQPATQTAEVPGGRRGHQGGPEVLPLGRGHQQRVHRGADIENHGLLWIPAVEGKPHQ